METKPDPVQRNRFVENDSLCWRRGEELKIHQIFERARGVNDEQVAGILLDYAWVLRQTARKSEARKLESHARAILAMHQNEVSFFGGVAGPSAPWTQRRTSDNRSIEFHRPALLA